MTNALTGLYAMLIDHSFFSFSYSLASLVFEPLSYGSYDNGCFAEGRKDQQKLIVYRKNQFARGIQIAKEQSTKTILLNLELPSTQEEINDYFQLLIHIAAKRVCEVKLNGAKLTPKNIETAKENSIHVNLKMLHEIMSNVLNEEKILMIPCTKRDLAVGILEAERMWAGIDTGVYRDWLHDMQKDTFYYRQPMICQDKGVYYFRADTACILPIAALPAVSYLRKHDNISIKEWFVDLSAENHCLGRVPFSFFINNIPDEKKHYLDALHNCIDPVSAKELLQLYETSRKENG